MKEADVSDVEIWRPVDRFEDCYMVSSHGRVRSLDRRIPFKNGFTRIRKGVAIRLQTLRNGYEMVALWRDGVREVALVHRLVAAAFIPNPACLPEVNHRDFDRKNNRSDNLEWMTHAGNCRYSESAGRADGGRRSLLHRAAFNPKMARRLNLAQVLDIRAAYAAGETQVSIAARLGINQGHVSKVVRGECWDLSPCIKQAPKGVPA